MSEQQTVEVTKTVRGEVIAQERRVIVVWHCSGCGVLCGYDAEYIEERRRDGKSFYCPNGCCRAYGENEAQRLQKQLATARETEDALLDRLAVEQRSHSATRGVLTKLQKRTDAGVCPHCHRTFQQVARHMKSKHTPGAKVGAG